MARLALGCGATVIPVGLVGTTDVQARGSNMMRPFRRVTIRFGPPLDLSRFEGDSATDPLTLRTVTDELMFEIRRLSGQVYVDRYAKRHGVVGGSEVAQVHAAPTAEADGGPGAPAPTPRDRRTRPPERRRPVRLAEGEVVGLDAGRRREAQGRRLIAPWTRV